MANPDTYLIKLLYERFNARDIDGVLAELTGDIAWANGMEGGHVCGHSELRDYWTRQWSIINPVIEPVSITCGDDGTVTAEVIQRVFDLNGEPLEGQTHGLKDKTVLHLFRIKDGKVASFDIRDIE